MPTHPVAAARGACALALCVTAALAPALAPAGASAAVLNFAWTAIDGATLTFALEAEPTPDAVTDLDIFTFVSVPARLDGASLTLTELSFCSADLFGGFGA